MAEPTAAQQAACLFIAALAEDVDKRRGIVAKNGTPATRCRIADHVRAQFFQHPTIEGEVSDADG
jgi:hypothetical protein